MMGKVCGPYISLRVVTSLGVTFEAVKTILKWDNLYTRFVIGVTFVNVTERVYCTRHYVSRC